MPCGSIRACSSARTTSSSSTTCVWSTALLDRALYYYVDNAGSLVHQGLNPVGVVKMKWNTYLPYLRLYRDLALFERFYERPSLYKFIFMPATDAFAKKDAEPIDPATLPPGITLD